MVQRGGLVFYGGLIGATASGLLYVWKRRLPLWKFADALAPSIALGYVPGRLGCLMNGCCYGRETTVPWPSSIRRVTKHFRGTCTPLKSTRRC